MQSELANYVKEQVTTRSCGTPSLLAAGIWDTLAAPKMTNATSKRARRQRELAAGNSPH
jgi:hypothetical protein